MNPPFAEQNYFPNPDLFPWMQHCDGSQVASVLVQQLSPSTSSASSHRSTHVPCRIADPAGWARTRGPPEEESHGSGETTGVLQHWQF